MFIISKGQLHTDTQLMAWCILHRRSTSLMVPADGQPTKPVSYAMAIQWMDC